MNVEGAPFKGGAHEAARCANDQGRFWPYHDALYVKLQTAPR